jgi:hypothetical protein
MSPRRRRGVPSRRMMITASLVTTSTSCSKLLYNTTEYCWLFVSALESLRSWKRKNISIRSLKGTKTSKNIFFYLVQHWTVLHKLKRI